MEHLDKLIPLAILGAIAGLLVFLLRRTIHHENAAPPGAESTPAIVEEPIQIEQPVAVKAPAAVVAALPVVAETPVSANVVVVEPRVRKRKLKKAPAPVVAVQPNMTPKVTVLDLLNNKHSLAAAFMLREILAPPVSKRN